VTTDALIKVVIAVIALSAIYIIFDVLATKSHGGSAGPKTSAPGFFSSKRTRERYSQQQIFHATAERELWEAAKTVERYPDHEAAD
jgi:hypothetical protein